MSEEGGTESWRDGLSAEYKDHDLVQQYDDLNGFVKTAIHAQGVIGQKGIIKPGEGASIEDYADYYEELGRPRDVSTYEFKDVKWPEEVQRNSDFEKAMLQTMYDKGVSQEAARGIYEAYAGTSKDQARALLEAREATQAERKAELKQVFGDAYDARMESAEKAWTTLLGSPESAAKIGALQMADGTTLGEQPDLIKAIAELGRSMSEDGMIGDKTPSLRKTPEEAQGELNNFMADEQKTAALYDGSHPNHKAIHAEWSKLQYAANAGGADAR